MTGDKKIVLVVAIGENGVIGRDGKLPWRLKSELQHFKRVTLNHPVVMGRKTFQSLKRPLPDRTNIVLTRNAGEAKFGVIYAADLDEALARANAVRFGLSASIFTRDAASVDAFVRRIEAGLIHVNQQTAGADFHVPFGGVKGSGYGPHEQGRSAIEFYTEVVTVYADV